ncbi:Protein of unknown function [Variovorax sp. YR634]|uniref:phage protein NinX family protein n=1 Tax=Variovorax sp. YR634 TaxID=1884385 RepID=UPI000894E384|nr:phage protein NinX family protein [Variovorax sp. YR634]SDX13531.1 Protein of unknown function [Variovorax sp. YR634]
MKTSELTGAQLDYWVAKAEGFEPEVVWTMPSRQFAWVGESIRGGSASSISHRFSQDWARGGPIMERERIGFTTWLGDDWCSAVELNAETQYDGGVLGGQHWQTGCTPLVAAMRAYVASKFGEEVPDA